MVKSQVAFAFGDMTSSGKTVLAPCSYLILKGELVLGSASLLPSFSFAYLIGENTISLALWDAKMSGTSLCFGSPTYSSSSNLIFRSFISFGATGISLSGRFFSGKVGLKLC